MFTNPYEIEQKLSPLIYKVRMTDGTSAILHINSLKEAYRCIEGNKTEPRGKSFEKARRTQKSKETKFYEEGISD
jgi:hypothetical protein